jgi:hypothetical protein
MIQVNSNFQVQSGTGPRIQISGLKFQIKFHFKISEQIKISNFKFQNFSYKFR